MRSRRRSAWPQCRAYSAICATRISRSRTSAPSGPRSETPAFRVPRSATPRHQPVGELHLGPPLPPGVVHDRRVGDRTVPVAVAVLVGAVQLGRVVAGHHPAEVPLLLGQVPHQPEQGHRGRRYGSSGELLGIQARALHLQGEAVVAQGVEQRAAFIDGLDIGFAWVVVRVDPHVGVDGRLRPPRLAGSGRSVRGRHSGIVGDAGPGRHRWSAGRQVLGEVLGVSTIIDTSVDICA